MCGYRHWVKVNTLIHLPSDLRFNDFSQSTGVGYHTVKILAQHGAKVYMAARSESKAKAAIEQLRMDGLGANAGRCNYEGLTAL